MQNLTILRQKYQANPFHLVEPSPWPLFTSFSLLITTIAAVMYMHGYSYGGHFLLIGLLSTVGVSSLWFRDVVAEGKRVLSAVKYQINLTKYWKDSINESPLDLSVGNQFKYVTVHLRDYTSNVALYEEHILKLNKNNPMLGSKKI